MMFGKWIKSWDGGWDLHTLEAIYFSNRVESEFFVNGKSQTGCKWVHSQNEFLDIIERNGWKPLMEVFP